MGLNHVRLRPEQPRDADAIRDVVVGAFGLPVIGELVDRLRASPDWVNGLSFVAEPDGRIIGHVLFTRPLLDAPQRLVDVLGAHPEGRSVERGTGTRTTSRLSSPCGIRRRSGHPPVRAPGTEDCSVGFGRGR